MTEEVKIEVVPEVKADEEVKEVVVVEANPVEVEATEQGWVPKEEWEASGRPPDEWRAAKEFVERGELYKTIHSLKRSERQTATRLDALQKHHHYYDF